MNSSSTVIPEPLQTPNLISAVDTATLNQENTSLPPFSVLIKWLSYYHTETGSWPEPGETTNFTIPATRAKANRNKPSLTIVPSKIKSANTSAGPDLAGMSEYDFQTSIYYRSAQALVEKYAPTGQYLNETGTLVFSSFLALCHHPAFLAGQQRSNSGLGMYLSLEQWSKGLTIRKATLGSCLKELEALGLIEVCGPSEPNNIKAVKRYYCLAVRLQSSLPVFDAAVSTKTTREPKPVSKAPEPVLAVVPSGGTGSKDNSMNMVPRIHDFKTNKLRTKNHEHGSPVEVGTVEEKLKFLSQQATFPGYTSPEGLTSLASGQAEKFAANPALDLFTAKQVYNQVLAAWASGKCTRNPIGFFHYSLTLRLKQKDNLPVKPGLKETPDTREPVPGNFNEYSSGIESVVGAAVVSQGIEEQVGEETLPLEIDLDAFRQDLKTQVVAAVDGRFKQPDLASKLTELEWECSVSGSKIYLKIATSADYSLSQSGITQSQLALLRIAVSQKIRNLLGINFGFELNF